jgi:hypothetical protein
MLRLLPQKFSIYPIIDQVNSLSFKKRLSLNSTDSDTFAGDYQTLPEFEKTPLGKVLDSLGKIGEARLLKLEPEETYMAHSDPDDRIHLSIITNPFSYIIDLNDRQMYHLPADGSLWLMDTGKTHVAANFGSRTRIHLNIRIPLPKVSNGAYLYKILGGDYDFKHIIQIGISSYLNRAIKEGSITGFRWVSDREAEVNFRNESAKIQLESVIKKTGLDFEIRSF